MRSQIELILAGDEQAVTHFYKEYSPRILRYLKQKLQPEEATEVLNEVFLDAIDSLPTLKKKANLSSWLYRIAHNKIVDIYRKRKLKTILLSQLPFLDLVASEFSEPEFIMEKNKIRDQIEYALYQQSEKYRQILFLFYEESRPVKEIALILNLSEKATESRLFRARQSFKEAYGRA